MHESKVEARQSLEGVFVRGRWLATLAVLLLIAFDAIGAIQGIVIAAALAAANVVAWRLNVNVQSLRVQRFLGLGATTVDTAGLLALVAIAAADLIPSMYAVLIVAVGEMSLRYTPVKAAVGWGALVAGLAAVMTVRHAAGLESFDARLLALWAVIITVVGAIVGLGAREIYRQRVTTTIESDASAEPQIDDDLLKRLSPRERQVLGLIVQGYSNQQIADALVIEPKTVKNHINNVYSKLHLNSRYEAIATVLGQRRGRDSDHD